MKTRYFIGTIAVAAALILLNEWRSVDAITPSPALAAPAASALPIPTSGMVAPAVAPAVATVGPQPRANVPGAMARRFNAAPSLRAFLYEAMRQPEEGGHHYAFVTLAACSSAITPAKTRTALSVRQREAIDALARRCDLSAEENEAARAQLVSSRNLNAEPDPLMPLPFVLLIASEPGERMAAFAAILDTQDPSLFWSLAEAGSAIVRPENTREIYFAGKYYPADSGTGLYDRALALAQCNFGVDCGPGSLPVLLICIKHNWCGESLGEAMRIGMGPERAAQYAQVQALAVQLTYEIKRKNARAFVAPR